MELWNLERERIAREIDRRKSKRVLLQVPDGLRPLAFELSRELQKQTSSQVIISADPCYGSCDLATSEASILDTDLIVHLGHSETPSALDERLLFIEVRSAVDITAVIKKAITELESEKAVGLASVVQHIGELEDAKKILEDSGKTVLIGRKATELKYDGQILGCQFDSVKSVAPKVDAFIVLAGGDFHGLGVRIATGRRTLVCDPFQNQVRDMEETARRYLRKRYAAIESFKQAKKIGILVGLKTGQFNPAKAEEMKRILEGTGCECALVVMREIDPKILENFSNIEGFVNTGCPRIALDDQERFRRPVLNPEEVMVATGLKRWEEYVQEDRSSERA
jgi:2-(3-amino-3-carboxypropyl)histidine synthase